MQHNVGTISVWYSWNAGGLEQGRKNKREQRLEQAYTPALEYQVRTNKMICLPINQHVRPDGHICPFRLQKISGRFSSWKYKIMLPLITNMARRHKILTAVIPIITPWDEMIPLNA
jgi:hypothetical protein